MKKNSIFSKGSFNLFLHILTQCNLACSHCYIDPKQHGYNSLNIDTIRSWLKLFYDKKNNPNVVFLGGEPTIHPKLDLAIKEARNIGYNSITVDTNGYLVSNILDKITPKDVDLFSFSLDGPTADANDMIRGKGSYHRCINAIKEVKNKGFRTSIIFTASRANFHHLIKMPELLFSLGVDRFFVQVIGIRGKWSQNHKIRESLKQVEKKSWLKIVPKIARKIAKEGIIVTYPKVFLKPNDIFECAGLLSKNYFVFPNGRVYQCPLCEDYPIHSKEIINSNLVDTQGINELSLFNLNISEGCVMNKIIQHKNVKYHKSNRLEDRRSCCMLKEEVGLS